MKKAVFLFDIDDTCYNGYSPGDLMKAEVAGGFYKKEEMDGLIADLKEKYMEKEPYEELAELYVRDMAKILAGKDRNILYEHAKTVFEKNIDKLNDFLPAIIDRYGKTHDFYFVSGGFDYSVQAVADIFGAAGYAATTLKTKDGVYQNEIIKDMSYAADKSREAEIIMKKYPKKGSIAFGDATADAGMMKFTEFGIYVHPNDKVKELAAKNGWNVVDDRKAVFQKVVDLLG
ncbi:hypothetical protein MsAg5_02680 [Methanosarcinaceae archaeon Ag5]|uniref:Phosphoserine phosphatase n=1 Tax=Methanolapillus africanus TaxID=3028297 RepID=A0AAE4MI91_9EURY|nr:hypothetical protein [Methanosarcinaceae archaeon Ag5]